MEDTFEAHLFNLCALLIYNSANNAFSDFSVFSFNSDSTPMSSSFDCSRVAIIFLSLASALEGMEDE
eukprot:scaffold71585_cov49-Attheya_sp.AAC.1